MTLLNDPEWSMWSDQEIARQCRVDEGLVRKLRPTPVVSADYPQIDEPRLITRNGTTYPMNTSRIGRSLSAKRSFRGRP